MSVCNRPLVRSGGRVAPACPSRTVGYTVPIARPATWCRARRSVEDRCGGLGGVGTGGLAGGQVAGELEEQHGDEAEDQDGDGEEQRVGHRLAEGIADEGRQLLEGAL